MLGSKQQTWIAVDIGGRWVKCARYVGRQGRFEKVEDQVIDIQAEGLLSSDEVAEAIERVLRAMGEHPLAVVLPQDSAVSQVLDLPGPTEGEQADALEAQVLELTGLSAERCVYDSKALEPGGGFSAPRWVTVAKEEALSRHISPLLGQGLHIEAATSAGNALVAAFQQCHPEVENASLVDLGATQTTVVRLRRGEPVQMASLVGGGENWTEALLNPAGEAFEELEMRLFRDNLFADPSLGQPLLEAVGVWQDKVLKQLEDWRGELYLPDEASGGLEDVYVFGGYAAIRGLSGALTHGDRLSWKLPSPVDNDAASVWLPSYGAVLMATGASPLHASILPRSLAKMRERRRNLAHLKTAALYSILLVAMVLGFGIFKQQVRLERLATANREADETLAEIKDTAALLAQAAALRTRLEPVVNGQLDSRDSLETFRRVQTVQEAIDFTLIRFVDQQTYFRGMENGPESDKSGDAAPTEPGPSPADIQAKAHARAFVVELTIDGGQAERLQVLGEIVGRLREERYFANVDRLLDRTGIANGVSPAGAGESYALLLTLSGERPLPVDGQKGAGR
jgi:hypothetical protein